ncbi:MAG: branched-chain amino acid ABC transporter permease [Lachnospiraceae bacterium]|nr:branched-chain amino acid ABC transporter permease [Lachnospiraceae bacterium]
MKQKRNILPTLTCITVLLLLVILLENINSFIPGLPQIFQPTSPLFTVLKKAAVYSLVAVSMNLLNGFTGLFSLGQAGFMLLGAYTYAILTVPASEKAQVYYLFGGCAFDFSLVDMFEGIFGTSGFGAALSMVLACLIALILAGCVAGFFAYLIGIPVLRLKSDYLAIATLGFAEILRAIFQWQKLGPVTNGANMIKGFPTFSSFNITDASGNVLLRLSTFVPFLISSLCIIVIVLLINSSYGRAFKSIRDDEIAAEAMGVSLFKHKMLSFVISSFFAGVGGALFAMYVANAQAKAFTSVMTYEILLIVVIGGIGSVSGSVLATFLYVACSEWWLRILDSEQYIGGFKVPLLRNGFRMVVFSVVIMVIVLFFSQGIMGNREINIGALLKKRSVKTDKAERKE